MKEFAELIKTLDGTNKTNRKVDALTAYFKEVSDKDKVWTIALLSHRRPPRPVNTTLMRSWAAEWATIPYWLFEESYHIVGDLAETIALIVPTTTNNSTKALSSYLEEIIALKPRTEEEKKAYLIENWKQMDYYQRFVFNKLITGGFRIGVSQKLMTRALSRATGVDEDILAYRLMGNWDPSSVSFKQLVEEENEADFLSKPYPFFLAYALEGPLEKLGNPNEWYVEHKWDGIRAQLIVRKRNIFIWSRGEELVTDKYPELHQLADLLPDGTVLDGELLPFPNGQIGSFNEMQTRIGRKKVSKALMKKIPVIIKAYDLLEWEGKDIRQLGYRKRREHLEAVLKPLLENSTLPIAVSPALQFNSWDEVAQEREKSRELRSEGLMLKRANSPYEVGRKKGNWWKWKVDPLTIDAVLTYAMRGHGRRSNLFTDYTFALWDTNAEGKRELVTFAKAYSGLTDAEFRKIDSWIKKNTVDRFGPVRQVTPHHVFEIAFEGIAWSKRHKSGVATRFPRMRRWRQDKPIDEANTLDDLKQLIPMSGDSTTNGNN
ncbi:ATP-dependent DNA ligase [Lentiprolixibacter aurantiacus]|uniref:DNA ligase (ATP) n=1 Tax=Lentiprolixibacter aurantiacus TaxID=2993939 RepID=A0AAE3MKQ4_9FLAO|nr:ATP-dependent DNA ligase [Lentiprolixibacter aurantiacus]MCX2718837.1 ATP-dependent DNA ligase [Lentiprolixibacter aurantiacus]